MKRVCIYMRDDIRKAGRVSACTVRTFVFFFDGDEVIPRGDSPTRARDLGSNPPWAFPPRHAKAPVEIDIAAPAQVIFRLMKAVGLTALGRFRSSVGSSSWSVTRFFAEQRGWRAHEQVRRGCEGAIRRVCAPALVTGPTQFNDHRRARRNGWGANRTPRRPS